MATHRSSPAAPASSARISATGCSPTATRSSASTTSSPGHRDNIAHLLGEPAASSSSSTTSPTTSTSTGRSTRSCTSPRRPARSTTCELPIQTLKVGSLGTHKALGLAKAKGARFLLASTSEVYGDPLVHPQPEDYWGNVNPIGPRGVYDEAKRFAEAMTMAYHRTTASTTRIVRIFNTYGPRMRLDDGRVVPNFIGQALRDEPLTVYGDGTQTRSFCYVSRPGRGHLPAAASRTTRAGEPRQPDAR